MATIMGIDNSIGWAHWRLRGWKMTLSTTLGYSAVVVGLMLLTVQLNSNSRTPVSGMFWPMWRFALVIIQGAILVMFGGSRIATAIRTDISSHMIESHRLMPVSPMTAISGYLWGPPAQALVMAIATFIIGLVLTVIEGLEIRAWLGPNFVLFTFALFCWVAAAYAGFLSKAAWAGVFIVVIVVMMSQGAVLSITPGMSVLFSPLIGSTIFQTRALSYELDWPMLVALIAQFFFGIIFYIGAARKYRKPEDSALAVLPGTALLACWVGVSIMGITYYADFQSRLIRMVRPDPSAVVVASIMSALFMAMIPVSNAAKDRTIRAYSPLIALLCAALAWSISLWSAKAAEDLAHFQVTAAIVSASFLLSLCFMLRIIYRVSKQGWLLAAIWTGIICVGPIIVDSVFWVLGQSDEDFKISSLSAFSPVGAMTLSANEKLVSVQEGLTFQVALALAWAAIFYLTKKRPKPL